jgi:hypothetical protein
LVTDSREEPRDAASAEDADPWRANEEARWRRLREDGRRPMAVNLAEGLALTEYLSRFTGSARDR